MQTDGKPRWGLWVVGVVVVVGVVGVVGAAWVVWAPHLVALRVNHWMSAAVGHKQLAPSKSNSETLPYEYTSSTYYWVEMTLGM